MLAGIQPAARPIRTPATDRPAVEDDRRDDQRRRDELAAVGQREPGVGQEQVTRRHRQPGDRPLEMPPADDEQPDHQPELGQARQHPREDHLCGFALQVVGERGVLDDAARPPCWRPAASAGCVARRRGLASAGFRAAPSSSGRLTVSATNSPSTPDREAGQARRVEVRLEQRPAGQAEVEQAPDQPEERAEEEPDDRPTRAARRPAGRPASSCPAPGRRGAGGRGCGCSRTG